MLGTAVAEGCGKGSARGSSEGFGVKATNCNNRSPKSAALSRKQLEPKPKPAEALRRFWEGWRIRKIREWNLGLPKSRKNRALFDLDLVRKRKISQRGAFSGSWKIKERQSSDGLQRKIVLKHACTYIYTYTSYHDTLYVLCFRGNQQESTPWRGVFGDKRIVGSICSHITKRCVIALMKVLFIGGPLGRFAINAWVNICMYIYIYIIHILVSESCLWTLGSGSKGESKWADAIAACARV